MKLVENKNLTMKLNFINNCKENNNKRLELLKDIIKNIASNVIENNMLKEEYPELFKNQNDSLLNIVFEDIWEEEFQPAKYIQNKENTIVINLNKKNFIEKYENLDIEEYLNNVISVVNEGITFINNSGGLSSEFIQKSYSNGDLDYSLFSITTGFGFNSDVFLLEEQDLSNDSISEILKKRHNRIAHEEIDKMKINPELLNEISLEIQPSKKGKNRLKC